MIQRVSEPQEREVLLAEYAKLKDEQLKRISDRDNMVYATFTVLAAVAAAAFTAKIPALLLAAQPAMMVFGWKYLATDIKVTEIGAYIRRELAPRLGGGAFGWELDAEDPRARRLRKTAQLTADLMAFPLAGAALALTAAIWGGLWMTPLAVIEILASLALAVPFVIYAELGGKS